MGHQYMSALGSSTTQPFHGRSQHVIATSTVAGRRIYAHSGNISLVRATRFRRPGNQGQPVATLGMRKGQHVAITWHAQRATRCHHLARAKGPLPSHGTATTRCHHSACTEGDSLPSLGTRTVHSEAHC